LTETSVSLAWNPAFSLRSGIGLRAIALVNMAFGLEKALPSIMLSDARGVLSASVRSF